MRQLGTEIRAGANIGGTETTAASRAGGHAEPPDVDYKNYDAWILLDPLCEPPVRERYDEWNESLDITRKVLDKVPVGKSWHDMDGALQEEFLTAKELMDTKLARLLDAAMSDPTRWTNAGAPIATDH